MLLKINKRQLGTILAALHLWDGTSRRPRSLMKIATEDGSLNALSGSEVSALANGINGGDLNRDNLLGVLDSALLEFPDWEEKAREGLSETEFNKWLTRHPEAMTRRKIVAAIADLEE